MYGDDRRSPVIERVEAKALSEKDLIPARWNKLSASSVLKPGTQLVLFIPQAAAPKATPAKKDLLLDLQNTLNHPR